MDWQQLPAIKGRRGYAYKISIIHLSSRIKYSEILDSINSKILADFLARAVRRLPPFYVVFTDNHMAFTMKYALHNDRKTAFTKRAESMNIIHALIPKGKPWRNGFIERSNRTDNEAILKQKRFVCEEHRRYELRLWEMYYNRNRPHQGLKMHTPWQKARQQHFCRVSNVSLC